MSRLQCLQLVSLEVFCEFHFNVIDDLISGRHYILQCVNIREFMISIQLLTIFPLIFQQFITSCLFKREVFRTTRSPFPRCIPGPWMSIRCRSWGSWSCRSSLRRLKSLLVTGSGSSRCLSRMSVTCWASAASGRQVLPCSSTSSSTFFTGCGWRLLTSTLRNGYNVIAKSVLSVCTATLHLFELIGYFTIFCSGEVCSKYAPTPLIGGQERYGW